METQKETETTIKNYKLEQLLVIVTSVLSLLTAGIWSEVMETIFEKHFKGSLFYKIVYAILITIVTVIAIDYLVTKTRLLDKTTHEKLQAYNLQNNISKVQKYGKY